MIAEQLVQPGDLRDEVVEPLVRCGELAERPDQQPRGARRPQEQRQMRQIPALGELARHVGHACHLILEYECGWWAHPSPTPYPTAWRFSSGVRKSASF